MCNFASSGCNGPAEAECMGLCTHRINTDTMTKRSVSIKGKVEQRMQIDFAGPEPKPESLLSRVWSAYKAHRPHGRMDGIRHAFAAWRN